MRRNTWCRVAATATLLAIIPACGSHNTGTEGDGDAPRLDGALTSFESCDEALAELKERATADADASDARAWGAAPDGAEREYEAQGEAPEAGADSGDHSGTNVQEAGVDEPDMVKTDGERIVVVRAGELLVLDADSREVAGSLELPETGAAGGELLLHGDRALVIMPETELTTPQYTSQATTTIALVSLAETQPELLDEYTIDAGFADARAIDGTVRVVVRSAPDLDVPQGEEDPVAAVRQAIDDSTMSDWLPSYQVNGEDGQVPCGALARPSEYSGTNTVTVLSFDVTDRLSDGSPVSITADGQTVYASQDALYIANDRRQFSDTEESTEIYRFTLGGDDMPQYHTAAEVPGYVLNQYSLSEWDGHLRVASTTDPHDPESSSSALYAFSIDGDLQRVGSVDGLGPTEKIEAVRYVGPRAYVVTFRQTDPLYTVDISDPVRPRETGELKMTGYSAYLHPTSNDRLLGVGPQADESGNITGLQVSLFDVEADEPEMVDNHEIPDGKAEVENDPHAFLFWPETKLLALPYRDGGGTSGLLTGEVTRDGLEDIATVEHPDDSATSGVSRALVIDDTLWSISDTGAKSTALDSPGDGDWVAFD